MELLNSKMKIKILLSIVLISQTIGAQNKGIILDTDTYKPIPYVNVFSTYSNEVFGTTSNTSGKFNVNFPFESLTFSHINYEKSEILRQDLKDTIFLTPKTNLIGEIVISNKQPQWIKNILERFRTQRKKIYRTTEKIFSYQYDTRTLNDSNGYAFKSEGEIIVPKLYADIPFRISPKESVIHYKDTSAGVDFSNMQRILYDEFISDFDKNFIKEHEFRQNHAYKGKSQNIIQLIFNSNEYDSDNGFIVMDTASCAILEVERSTGTDFNIKEQTSAAVRAIASKTKGFNYEEWVIYNYTQYESFDGSYYPIDCRYKLYLKSSTKKKKRDDLYFVSIESELSLKDKKSEVTNNFIDIPRPYYMLLVKSKKMRLDEERLRSVPVKFDTF